MQESKTLHYILGISLVMIAVFVVASLVMINSQAQDFAPNTLLGVTNTPGVLSNVKVTLNGDGQNISGNLNLTAGMQTNYGIEADLYDINGVSSYPSNVSNAFRAQYSLNDMTALSNTTSCVNDGGASPFLNCSGSDNNQGLPIHCVFTPASNSSTETSGHVSCPLPLSYATTATDAAGDSHIGRFQMIAFDGQDPSNVVTATREINGFVAVTFTNLIDYGTQTVGAYHTGPQSSPFNQAITPKAIMQANLSADATWTAGAMNCAVGSIPKGNRSVAFYPANATSTYGWEADEAHSFHLPNSGSVALDLNVPLQTNPNTPTFTFIEAAINLDNLTGIKGPCTGADTVVFGPSV